MAGAANGTNQEILEIGFQVFTADGRPARLDSNIPITVENVGGTGGTAVVLPPVTGANGFPEYVFEVVPGPLDEEVNEYIVKGDGQPGSTFTEITDTFTHSVTPEPAASFGFAVRGRRPVA